MPKGFGGAEQLRRGDRVRVVDVCYRHYLRGLEGTVMCVLHHGAIVALDNDPMKQQKVLGTNTARGVDQTQGRAAPKIPNLAQRQFQFNELVKIPRA